MLESRFSKKKQIFKANKIFTDRKAPRDVFTDTLDLIMNETNPDLQKRIIVFYGKGGIGKTSLLKEISTLHSRVMYKKYLSKEFHNVYISLEAYDYTNPVNILCSIRSQLHGDCSLFDYALVQYYAKARVSIEEIKMKNLNLSSSVMDLLNEAIGIYTSSSSIPKAIIEKSFGLIKDTYFKALYQEEIEEINTLDEFDIFDRLPYYLGLCVSHASKKNHEHVIFFDSYESIYSRIQGKVSSRDCMEWLKEFFLACDRVLFVIASRDRLRWDKENAEWNIYFEQHRLANLSDDDSRWFLEQVPIKDHDGKLNYDTINDIIKHANGVPLYLDLCVGLYERSVNNNISINFKDFKDSNSIIERYIRHLSEKDKYSVGALAILNTFDMDFAITLLEKFNLIYHPDEFGGLLEKSLFVELDDQSPTLWKVDESIRVHILENTSFEQTERLLEKLLFCILESRNTTSFLHLASILERVIETPAYIPPIRKYLFESIEYYSSAGYWNEIRTILTTSIDSENKDLQALAIFSELIYLRRTGRLQEAIALSEKYPLEREYMDVWYYMYRFILIHIHHLSGEYDKSLLDYCTLLDEITLIKSFIPPHIYNMVAIKYADLLFLKGNFEESLALTNEMLEQTDLPLEDKIELLRIKGHIYRFRKSYREATLIYETALEHVQKYNLKSLEGKLYTNLAEANCMYNPHVALNWYEKALDIHVAVDNLIEEGKSHAAASVAHTRLEKYDLAIELAEKSKSLAEKSGYKSGIVFALATLAFAQQESGNPEACESTLEQAQNLINEINVYQYLLPRRR